MGPPFGRTDDPSLPVGVVLGFPADKGFAAAGRLDPDVLDGRAEPELLVGCPELLGRDEPELL